MRGWLAARLGINPKAENTTQYPRLRTVELTCANGDVLRLTREDGTATFSRTGQVDRQLPLVRRPLGDELAEELRRLDPDQIYAEALGALADLPGLHERSPHRVHIWKDPAVSERPDAPASPIPDGAGAGSTA
jgi:glucose-6-phosphate dehydrogenase assembly protein OpcA